MKQIDELTDYEILIGLMKESDCYYLITVKGEKHFSSVGGKYIDENKKLLGNLEGLSKLMSGMVGSVNEAVNTGNGNGVILLNFIQFAFKNVKKLYKII